SGGPKRNAKLARGGATNVKANTPRVPPTNDAIAPTDNATPALPFRASGYPSNVVTTEGASPGKFSKTDGIRPPNIDPRNIPERKIIEVSAGSPKDNGKSIAITVAGPRPGNAPIRVPMKTPRATYNRFTGC